MIACLSNLLSPAKKHIMKKTFVTLLLIGCACITQARDNGSPLIDRSLVFDIVNICAMLLVLYMITSFILRLIQQNLDYRIKNKIADKGIAEPVASQLLTPGQKDFRKVMLQWFFTLAGIGVGFGLMSVIRPFGLPSLSVMALSMAAGFGGYYLATRQPKS